MPVARRTGHDNRLRLDVRLARPYVSCSMLRKLLMLMALLSGLTAMYAPERALAAQSSVSGTAAEVCDAKKTDARCECHTAISLRDWRIVVEKICRPRSSVIYVPTVYLGVDRAYE